MGGITEAVVEEIKARVNIAELIASYGIDVRTAGASKKACCPFHHEKTPSFNINENAGYYHCFGCGESGDAIKFVEKFEGLGFVEAVRKLAEQCHIRIEEQQDEGFVRRRRLYSLLAELAQFYHRCLGRIAEAAAAREYLKTRELSSGVQETYLIGYAPSGTAAVRTWAKKHGYTDEELAAAGVIKLPERLGDDGYHRFGGRLMFTIRDRQGRVVGFSGRQLVASKNSGKYVNSPETEVFKKSNVLYGFDLAAGPIARGANREVIVCEGQIDCIRLQTSGFPNSVAGQGTAFTGEHVAMLRKAADQVALCYDDDGAGHKATIKSARLCLAAGLPVRVVSLPGGDDPDSFIRKQGPEAFRKMLDAAESIMSFQVRAERAKERDPDSVDAVNRTVRELLMTVAACPNEVIKAGMVGEAARLTGLPTAALTAELGKVRVAAAASSAVSAPAKGRPASEAESAVAPQAEAVVGETVEKVLPPPPRELAFCAFLMANEGDAEIDGMVGEFLPEEVFLHPFTFRFVTAWRLSNANGPVDALVAFREGLPPEEQPWFDRILLGQDKSQASFLEPREILCDFVRALWGDHLQRVRGSLPAVGDAELEQRRMKLSLDISCFRRVDWDRVAALIRDRLTVGEREGKG